MGDPVLLFIDDDKDALTSLVRAVKASGIGGSIYAASNAETAQSIASARSPHAIVLDLCLDESRGVESGFELLQLLIQSDPTYRIIVLTGHGSSEHGNRSLRLGAANFLQKPADIDHLTALILDGVRQAELRRAYTELEEQSRDRELAVQIIGESSASRYLRESILFAASTSQAVLIQGETGTGKGLCALAVHEMSERRGKRFVRCHPNYGASDIVNSELFGYRKGAFTGAEQDRSGLLEVALGGTLFLDEVDALPEETQVALLGVLQDRRYRPIGSTDEVEADFRLLCATNREVSDCVRTGQLREDFYHRVAHEIITIPPLRERLEDIKPLVRYFLREAHQSDQTGVLDAGADVLQVLGEHSWPGNIRELQAVVKGAAFRARFEGRTNLLPGDVRLACLPGQNGAEESYHGTLHDRVDQFKFRTVQSVLDRNAGNQVRSARELGIDRSTLRRILQRIQGDQER